MHLPEKQIIGVETKRDGFNREVSMRFSRGNHFTSISSMRCHIPRSSQYSLQSLRRAGFKA